MIHVLPRGCPGGEIEYDQVAGVLGSSFVGPDEWVVNIEAFKRPIVLTMANVLVNVLLQFRYSTYESWMSFSHLDNGLVEGPD